jgi:hypothetical protein
VQIIVVNVDPYNFYAVKEIDETPTAAATTLENE